MGIGNVPGPKHLACIWFWLSTMTLAFLVFHVVGMSNTDILELRKCSETLEHLLACEYFAMRKLKNFP